MNVLSAKNPVLFLVMATVTALLSQGCGVSRYLQDEAGDLLVKNKVKIQDAKGVTNKGALKNELSTIYKQKPNEKSFWFFRSRLWTYYRLKNTEQLAENENSIEKVLRKFFSKKVAEPPAIFDENLAVSTAQTMKYYLQSRGYFNAEVFHDKLNVSDNRIIVTYYATLHKQYLIDSVAFKSEDPVIHQTLKEIAKSTFLKKGEPVDGRLYDQEVNRITRFLRNAGYAHFTPNYVAPLDADTADFKAKIVLEVLTPGKGKVHHKYEVGQVIVDANYNPVIDTAGAENVVVDSVIFKKAPGKDFWVRPAVVKQSIFLQPGELFNQDDLEKTNRQLNNLGVFRFVYVRQAEDTVAGKKLDFIVEMTPVKQWEFGWDTEMNNTERNLTNSRLNFLGASFGVSLNNRNLFRGAELFLSNGSFGSEINLFALRNNNIREVFNTLDVRVQFDFYKPKFLDYIGIYRLLARTEVIRPVFYESLVEKSPTRISAGYNYLSLYNFYNYHLFNTSFGYDLQKPNHRYIINHMAVDFLYPTTEPPFDSLLASNPFLQKSFGEQLFSGFFIKNFTYIFNSKVSRFGESSFFQVNTELSGTEVWAVNSIYNTIAGRKETFRFSKNVEYSQFFKAELDARHFRQFNPRHGVAFRVNIGIARPFGFSDEVPYVKQFYVGGPQSLRAWGARGLGPGSYRDSLTENEENRLLFYQTGDFKIELNGEYRFDLFKFFGTVTEAAFFLDIGNVWTIKEDERLGGQLLWKPKKLAGGTEVGDNFLKQLAIGTGFGVRLDFSYFLLRFDLGYRIKNPYKKQVGDAGRLSYLEYQSLRELRLDDINFNLGINYPF